MAVRARGLTEEKLTAIDLAALGDGQIGYIRSIDSAEAERRFPAVEGLPQEITLFVLHAADGTPLCLADSRDAAIAHAIADDLQLAGVH
jgi:hypothetical protein